MHNAEERSKKEPARLETNHYENARQATMEGGYEPELYSNLPVSAELKELFKSIQR